MIPQKFKNIKLILASIINDGSKSKHINEFVNICSDIALIHYRKSIYKDELFQKECYNEKVMTYDLIADIFENRGGCYVQINNFFKGIMKKNNNIPDEVIIAKIVVLVRSTVNQRISEIRENYGEPYFKIKKAFESFVSRNKEGFQEVVFRDIVYIYLCAESEIDFDLPQIPDNIFLNELFNNKFETYSIPEVLRKAFDFMKLQNEYCKAVEKTLLLNYISKFYKKRFKDNISINVEYFK